MKASFKSCFTACFIYLHFCINSDILCMYT